MNNDLTRAKDELIKNGYSCVLCLGESLYTSTKNGVAPLVGWLDEQTDFTGFSAADKIVGKASALLFVLCGVTAVYAKVISEAAAKVFEKHGLSYEYGQMTPFIKNRTDTGLCPMETAVQNEDDPKRALILLKNKIKELREAQPKADAS